MTALLWTLTAALAGDDAISLQTRATGTADAPPYVELTFNQQATNYTTRVVCDDDRQTTENAIGAATQGSVVRIELPASVGQHTCTGQLSATFSDGSKGEMPLQFSIEVQRPWSIDVPAGSVDLEERRFQVVINRPVRTVSVEAFGPKGLLLGTGTGTDPAAKGAGQPIDVQWTQERTGELLRLVVKATDPNGQWKELELVPWSYAVPHEDVVFESGKHAVTAAQEPKLYQALNAVRTIQGKYGDDIPIHLFVGGYTDSVGDRASNQALSQRRAVALAEWFVRKGFTGDVFAQGFGEDGQLVATPDGTDEAQNRRAVYLLAASPSAPSDQLPASNWKRIK